MTAYTTDKDRRRSAESGIDLCLEKPIHKATLAALLARV